MSIGDYKFEARKALKGKWIKVGFLVFIYYLLITICGKGNSGLVSTARATIFFRNGDAGDNVNFSLLATAIEGVLFLGLVTYLMNIAKGKEYKYSDLFSKIGYVLKSVVMAIVIMFYVFCWSLLFIIPGIIKLFAYSMSFYILAQNPEKGINQCISESQEMMRGNKMKYFGLRLSFILWIIVVIVALMTFSNFMPQFSGWSFSGIETTLAVVSLLVIFNMYFYNTYYEMALVIFYLDVSGQYYSGRSECDVETIAE